MPSRVESPQSSALVRHIGELRGMPESRKYADLRSRLRRIVLAGQARQVMAGKDGQGRTMAPLAPSTLNRRRGNGPPLAPRGMSSRIITTFRADWSKGGGGDWEMARGWYGFDSPDGFPIAAAHATGASRSLANGRRWVLPKRDSGPISPTTWAEIRREHWAFVEDYTRPR